MIRTLNIEMGLQDGACGMKSQPRFSRGLFFYENARRIGWDLERCYEQMSEIQDKIDALNLDLDGLREEKRRHGRLKGCNQ